MRPPSIALCCRGLLRFGRIVVKNKLVSSISCLLILVACCSKEKSVYSSPQSTTPAVVEKIDASVSKSFCPDGMIEIDGEYCHSPEQICLQWVDADGKSTEPPMNTSGRCGVWKKPVKCMGKTTHKHYCIDTYEYPNKKGQIPQDWMTWYDVRDACKSEGKRMCTRSEWTLAAEGPNMNPYPFGDGYHRDKSLCNFDNHVGGIDVFKAKNRNTPQAIELHNMLVPSGSKEQCVSGWGVHDMSGNIDEFVINESGKPYVSGLMGGHIFGVRNASRPMTDAHGPDFSWYESGGRCCKSE